MNDDLLTTDEAATLLGIAPATLRRWVMKGWLTPVKRATNPLMFRYLDVENARIARLPTDWHHRMDDLAARWERACLESSSG